jgi:SNF2 family DNA or RNA helicase
MDSQQHPRSSVTSGDDDFVEISRPTNQPAFAAKPVKTPMFASQPVQPKPINNFIDFTVNTVGMATDDDLFHDRSLGADPYMYMNAGKATEDIKALLEGAFEDEDDKPRTRRKKQAEDTLAAKMNELKVKGTEKEAEPSEEDEEEEDDGTVEGMKVKLLPHQVEGVNWMRDKELGTKKTRGVFPRGGILADDMGLGKTIQSIALIMTNQKPSASQVGEGEKFDNKRKLPASLDKGTLVVAPLALIKQWEGEIRDRVEDTHTLRVCVHHGPQRAKSFKELKKYDVVITTYHTLVSEHGSSGGELKVGCFGIHWYRVILDEAHSIKNRNAKATKAACALKAEYRWCLTGTPMQNNLDELQSLIHFLQIKPYDNLNAWREQISRPMNNGRGGLAIKRLQVYLKAFMKRRTKDILKQEGALRSGRSTKDGEKNSNRFKIVKRTVEKVEAEFTPLERGFYERLESRTDKSLEQMMAGNKISYASALVLLLRLRQACNHANLIKGDLAKERDAFVDGSGTGSQTPGRKKAVNNTEMDSISAMLGGLSVTTKRCDVCQIELSPEASASGAIRCAECEADLEDAEVREEAAKKRRRKKAIKSSKREYKQERAKPRRNIITDSDDEGDEGEWIVPEEQRQKRELGTAGGSEDEDAEGGGESIGLDSEEDVRPVRRKKKSVNLVSDEEDQGSGSEDEDESSSDDDDDDDENEEELSSDDQTDIQSPIISTKIRHLLRILHRDSAKHKYIIFSFFTSMLDLIEPFLRRDNLTFTRYDGSMKNDLREASLDRLRNHHKTRILLCSLRAGSLGLNLTAASRVVILEPFWNPVCTPKAPLTSHFETNANVNSVIQFVEEQAIDRVHRLNQTQDVIVYKLTIKDTVEARILDLQDKKRQLADATIEGKTAAAKLTMEDMLKLFRHDAEHAHAVDGIGLGLGKVLKESSKGEVGAGSGSGSGSGDLRRPEHAVYGRRW